MNELQVAISGWLRSHLALVFNIPAERVDGSTSFERYGMDSAAIVGLTGDLGHWLGCDIDPAAPYEHPTIDQLSHALARDLSVQAAFEARVASAAAAGNRP